MIQQVAKPKAHGLKFKEKLKFKSKATKYAQEIKAARDSYKTRLDKIEAMRKGKDIKIFEKVESDWFPPGPLPVGKYARVFKAVLASAAWAALSEHARDMYWFLMGRFSGKNNGRLSAPMSVLRLYGWRSSITRARALAELDQAMLVRKARDETKREPAFYKIVGLENKGD